MENELHGKHFAENIEKRAAMGTVEKAVPPSIPAEPFDVGGQADDKASATGESFEPRHGAIIGAIGMILLVACIVARKIVGE